MAMENECLLAPSLLSADFAHLAASVDQFERSQAQWLHLDIMDGVFVPNISYGFPVVEAVAKLTKKVLDAHLMIVQPDRYVERFAKTGVQRLTVHYEACDHLHRTLQHIHAQGMKAGVAINPHTPPELLLDILEEADQVLVMSVNPGFGGQKFIHRALSRVERLRSMIAQQGLSTLIEVDGGVGLANCRALHEAGADVLVAGSAAFAQPDPCEAMNALLREANGRVG